MVIVVVHVHIPSEKCDFFMFGLLVTILYSTNKDVIKAKKRVSARIVKLYEKMRYSKVIKK